ncbi:type II secretion system F family protein [Nocardioides massiliensis]|uniref:Tight adherence protein C n=1 Tax=Nocardioides massiliensis TaxID=1325935 RepID=A0ABT9NT43_9ACTN|nr:type II secretion system F family protein [Nocardioides massiliensis]MDP9823563.1 tight adherence protein C [Nocardioides massiliensis]
MTLLLVAGVACVFTALLLGLIAAGALTRETPGVNRSLAVMEALTSAPEAMREQELDQPFRQRVVDPLLGRALTAGRRLTPADYNIKLREKLERAGNPGGWTIDRVVALKVIGFVAALVISLLLSLMLGLGFGPTLGFVVIASLAGFNAPNLYLYQRAYDRDAELRKGLADSIDLLTISVESGLGFDAALSYVARNTEGPLSEEFARVLQEMQIGRGRTEALRSLADRTTLPELRSFVSAMVQADSFGIPIGQVLRVQSTEIRTKRRQWAEEQAQKVPVKILVPLIFCILPCLFIAVLGPAVISVMDSFSGRM